jgi:phage shock protein A
VADERKCPRVTEEDRLRARVAALEAERAEVRPALESVAAQLATSRAGVRAQRMRAEAAESRSAALEEALRGLAEEWEADALKMIIPRRNHAAELRAILVPGKESR